MKFGFDLDGVLLTQNNLHIALVKGNKTLERLYYETLVPQLNPYLFMSIYDTAVIVTARSEEYFDITRKQCTKFFPAIPFYMVSTPQWTDTSQFSSWMKEVARRKAAKLKDLEVDIYFEDLPETVLLLRDICPDIAIVQYGGRI